MKCICGKERKVEMRGKYAKGLYVTCGDKECVKKSKWKTRRDRMITTVGKRFEPKVIEIRKIRETLKNFGCIECGAEKEKFEIRCNECLEKYRLMKIEKEKYYS